MKSGGAKGHRQFLVHGINIIWVFSREKLTLLGKDKGWRGKVRKLQRKREG